MIIDDFTGHEHLLDFGLINMNGRMYDPLLSSFLSPDNYMQDPTSQQGFNRYAYCMYNPLKYVDPSGERQMGWVYSTYQYEQAAKHVFSQWNIVYDDIMMKQAMTLVMANTIYSDGPDACGGRSGSGNHGSPGGSVEVKAKGDGKYEVVKGLYDGGNTVYIVDDQGNRTGILGYTLTNFGFGCYISSARDIGNFAAGYLCGIKAVTYRDTREAFDAFNMITHRKIEGEPPVSRLAQDMGYIWGVHNFYNKLFKRY